MVIRKKLALEYLLFALLFMLISLLFCTDYRLLSFNAISVWAVNVAPIVLPYLILTGLIKNLSPTRKICSRLGKLINKTHKVSSNIGSALFVSLLCGLPVGLNEIALLKNNRIISQQDAVKSCIICSTPSPIFLIASFGRTMCNNALIGLIILASNYIACFITSLILCRFKFSSLNNDTFKPCKAYVTKPLNPFYSTVWGATINVLYLGATLSLGYLTIELLHSINVFSPVINLLNCVTKSEILSKGVVFGLIESTKGLSVISSSLTINGLLACSFISSFGGLSIIIQSAIILKSAKIKTAPFLLSKFLSAVLSVVVTYFILLVFV